jgi:hypothetical protein
MYLKSRGRRDDVMTLFILPDERDSTWSHVENFKTGIESLVSLRSKTCPREEKGREMEEIT